MPNLVSPGVATSEIDLTTAVPNVSTTTGAFAGIFTWGPVGVRTLVDSDVTLVNTFGKPTDNNFETFFTAANFLSYGNSLYVTRVIDGANNAYANTGAVTGFAVKNDDDFANTTLQSNVTYLARYPGAGGNSLKISVCDSAAAYEQTVNTSLLQGTYTNVTSITLQSNSGSNVATLSLVANTLGLANTATQNVVSWLSVGDLIDVGNSTVGFQTVKITGVTPSNTEVANSGSYTSTATVRFNSPVVLPANVLQTAIPSRWEYYSQVDKAPGSSNWMAKNNLTANDELHVVVVDQGGVFTGAPGTVLEVFKGLSRATDAKTDQGSSNYYKTVLNTASKYIYAGADRTGAASANSGSLASATTVFPYTFTFNGGGDGNGESNCSLTSLTSGYDLYKNVQDINISLVLTGKARGVTAETTAPSSSVVNYSSLANYIISNIGEYRKDCVVFVSPAKPDATNIDPVTSMLAFRSNLAIASSYAVLDSGYKYQYDKYNDKLRWVPLNGDIAGTCAYTDSARDPWFSPAGAQRGQIKNVVKLALNPGQAQRDLLYKNDINPVVTFPSQGTILYGDKTLLGRSSAFDRINVRRLFIVLEKAISNAAKSMLFEFNDDFTRAQFVNMIEPYLRDVQGRRGITDFYIVCDSTNNTQQVIDTNQFVGDIYIKPNRSINYISLNFVAVRSGVEFSEIVNLV